MYVARWPDRSEQSPPDLKTETGKYGEDNGIGIRDRNYGHL